MLGETSNEKKKPLGPESRPRYWTSKNVKTNRRLWSHSTLSHDGLYQIHPLNLQPSQHAIFVSGPMPCFSATRHYKDFPRSRFGEIVPRRNSDKDIQNFYLLQISAKINIYLFWTNGTLKLLASNELKETYQRGWDRVCKFF